MISDTHVHTSFSKDSTAAPPAQVERCLALGMKEVCITDHHDYQANAGENDFVLDFSDYLPYMERLRQRYAGRIRVNVGVELGLQLRVRPELEALANSLKVDYLIGSSLFVDGKDPYFPEFFEGKSEKEAYGRYFQVTLERIRAMDCFDAFGHLDYIVRYGPNTNRHNTYQAYREWIGPILETLIEKGKALECNTAGFRYGLGQPNPSEDILRHYRSLGGELITVGSDAHEPGHVAYGFDRLPGLLKSCGFRYYTVYHSRIPEFIPL